jgi:hypothetical protein
MPVTPPSIKRLDKRKPFRPKAAENMPATTSAELINVFQNRFTGLEHTLKATGIHRPNAKTVAFLSPNPLF